MKRKSKQKTTPISALTARTQLGQIMRRATERRERFLVGRRGQPAVVIMSVEDYADAMAPAPGWLEAAWREAEAGGTDTLTAREIDREVRTHRQAKRQRSA
ncbi:MAG: type II toxin-antitoxin system Phd/YefM family antitoxin [Acidobacteriaceae bacterium]